MIFMKYNKIRNIKICQSSDYNWIFDTETGKFARWGKTCDDDPIMAPMPEILDIEISTICHQGCSFCYKSNTSVGKNMTLDEFKEIFSKFDTRQLTQIAFGIGSIDANPYLYDIMQYCRDNDVVPNITINSFRMTEHDYKMLAKLAGAVAVSAYDFDSCFNCVQRLNEAGLKQVNIHQLLSNETFDDCAKLARAAKTDTRLVNLNAIVYLSLKEKGSRNTFTSIKDIKKYKELIDYLFENEIRFGFDSCSCNNFLTTLKNEYPDKYEQIAPMCEPCESSLFSYYINVDGIAYPCSFSEDVIKGIDLKTVDKFSDIWSNSTTEEFRTRLLNNNRSCPLYNLEMM